jgi:predicted aspartyl protease
MTKAQRARGVGLWILLMLCGGFARADDACRPLTLITTVNLVHRDGDQHVFVPVTINGKNRFMLLDTGGASTEVTSQAVADLGLPYERIRYSEVNLSGEESHQAAEVDSFSIGQLTTKSVEFVVAPERYLFIDEPQYVGIIAPNVLKNYDVDIDFGTNKLSLLSPDHCEGKVIYWPASAVAVIPMHVQKSGHILIPVQLDGKEIYAVLDTGAPVTTLMMPIAESDFGLKMGAPDTPRSAEMPDRPSSATYQHKFSSLNFGGIAVSNLNVSILPDFIKNKIDTPGLGSRLGGSGSHEEAPDMLIGLNVLRHLHVYIAYKEQKLYITAADPMMSTPVASGTTPSGLPNATHLRIPQDRGSGF